MINEIIKEIIIKIKQKIIIENDVYLKFEVYECTVEGM